MNYRLPYGPCFLDFRVPDMFDIREVRPRRIGIPDRPEVLIERALDAPVAAPTLESLVSRTDRILILCDDDTRPTPVHRLLPSLLRRLMSLGIPKRHIRFLMAYGLHKPMGRDALCRKLGVPILSGFPLVHHNASSPKDLVRVGETALGTPVSLNRALLEADVTIGIGNLSLSKEAGYGGGAKIVMPGTAGAETIYETHARVADHPNQVGKIGGNPIRREIEESGKLGRLGYIINTVLDEKDEICRIVAGDPLEAFRKGVSEFNAVYRFPLHRPFDLLVVSSSPMDGDFYQANKALTVSSLGVRNGGMIIMVGPCPNGLSPFPYFDDMITAGKTFSQWQDLMHRPGMKHQVAAEICLGLRYLTDVRNISIGLVTTGIRPETVVRMGLIPFPTIEAALETAARRLGRKLRLAIVPKGPLTLFEPVETIPGPCWCDDCLAPADHARDRSQ